MTVNEIMEELQKMGSAQTKKTYLNHGALEPLFGVKVGDLKTIVKKVKKNHELSLELYQTNNSDAMYLAGLIADETKITVNDLQKWVKKAYWYYLSEFSVPWVASETTFGFELGLQWIKSDKENIAAAGWATLSGYASVNQDKNLDIKKYSKLLDIVNKKIHNSPNRVQYCMNNYVIAIGSYIQELTNKAKQTAEKIGIITIDMKGTACKTPNALDYIKKVEDANKIGNKKKTARC
jgi:3-methyladenine DNA glycosylase AlkD